MEQRASHDEFAISGGQYHHQLPLQIYQYNPAPYYPNATATDEYTPSVSQSQPSASFHQLPSRSRLYQDSIVAHSSNPAAPVQYTTTSDYWQHGHEPYLPLQKEASLTVYNSNLIANTQYASSVLQTRAPVPYDQSSLQGAQYQASVVAAPTQYTTSVLQPQVQVTYLPLQREALYQHNVAPYNSNPTTVPAQYTSISQPRDEALH